MSRIVAPFAPDAAMAQLALVNRQVNRDVGYVSDARQYLKTEYWAVAGKRGDCEDIAMAKLKRLRDSGWPKGSLDIGICTVGGTGHAVLVAHLETGDFVLDNNHDEVRPWHHPDYDWFECSIGGSFRRWHKVVKNAPV